MIRIFYQDKDIIFDENDQAYDPKEIIRIEKDHLFSPERLIPLLEERERAVLLNPDPRYCYERFVSFLDIHEAGGGIVVNGEEKVLLISRNERWDLPKGHLEPWETMEECALREVSEECGIHGMEMGDYVGLTEHIYRLQGKWILKSTHWYIMFYDGNEPLVPQAEEGITRIEWVEYDVMRHRLQGSYATLRHLVTLIDQVYERK